MLLQQPDIDNIDFNKRQNKTSKYARNIGSGFLPVCIIVLFQTAPFLSSQRLVSTKARFTQAMFITVFGLYSFSAVQPNLYHHTIIFKKSKNNQIVCYN